MSVEQQPERTTGGAFATARCGSSESASPFGIEVQREHDRVRVTPRGGFETAAPIDEALQELRAIGRDHLVLDLRRAAFVDCATLRALLVDARARARQTRTRLEVLCDAGQLVERLMALTGTGEPPEVVARSCQARSAARLIDEVVAA